MDSKRYPLASVSPTVSSGGVVTPGMTGASIDASAARNALGFAPASAEAAPVTVTATAAQAPLRGGMDSKRYPLDSVSQTVSSGVVVTPGMTGASIDASAVRNPLLLAPASAEAAAITVTATAVQATIERLIVPLPQGSWLCQVY